MSAIRAGTAINTSNIDSPFHRGEREIQERLGVRERIEDIGRRFIREHLPDEHREFYAQLPFLVVGSIDTAGRPWASALVGRPGFACSPDPYTLQFATRLIYGDPLNDNLVVDSELGFLGIDFHTRRRNRSNGRIVSVDQDRIEVRVAQTFGNCPQYIQAREFELLPAIDRVGEELPVERLDQFGDTERSIIRRADHFFIATYFSEDRDNVSHGADVSHRGGKPGFVRIDDARTLMFPDFNGNFHLNTLGNILLNPRVGLLFIDFERKDLLYLTGGAEIIWDSEESQAFTGAERLVRFVLDEGVRVERALPIDWRFREYSPSLDATGSWEEVEAVLKARREGNVYRDYRVMRIEREAANITSFYLEPADGAPIPCHRAGQFLPLELHPSDTKDAVRRTYTISNAPNGTYYRLSIKREAAPEPGLPPGLASNYFHNHVEVGTVLRAMSPRGKFTLDEDSVCPVVLVSGGVGITPMISTLEQLVADNETCGCKRPVWFIHGARNGAEHAFGDHVRSLAARCNLVHVHFRYSQPTAEDRSGSAYDSVGHVDIELFKSLLPFDDHTFYLCGPTAFMQAMYSGLKSLNVVDDRIRYEFFGEGLSLHERGVEAKALGASLPDTGPVPVRFSRSDIETAWDPSKGTLLDLAESEGLRPAYSCRSGICHTCTTKIVSGKVDYIEPPMAVPEEGEVLICCSYPRPQADGTGTNNEIILDL